MFRRGRPRQVAEYEAEGEVERVYHEVKETLRVTGVSLLFRILAPHERLLTLVWHAVRGNAATDLFERAADEVRAEAVGSAAALGRLDVGSGTLLGPSQRAQVQAALDLYHYLDPKLLLIASAIRLGLDGERLGQRVGEGARREAAVATVPRGAPVRMYPMETVAEDPRDPRLRGLFDDIRRTFSLASIHDDYRTLALWPDYLIPVWSRLEEVVRTEAFHGAADDLRRVARRAVRALPYAVPITRERVLEIGEAPEALDEVVTTFERSLASLLLEMSLVQLDWRPAEAAARPSFAGFVEETRPVPVAAP